MVYLASKYNWLFYNISNLKLSKKIINFNKKKKINYVESGLYNHVRDIFCLTILLCKNRKRKTRILDYGSNLLALSNLNSKIKTNDYKFSIYDPFYSNHYKNIKKPFNIKFYTDNKILKLKKFDIINFGSSLQYLENISDLIDSVNFKFVNSILITHTPITNLSSYRSSQDNHQNLIQTVHSIKKIINFFNKFNFKLIFKSRNSDKFIGCYKKKSETYSLNLLFIKKNKSK